MNPVAIAAGGMNGADATQKLLNTLHEILGQFFRSVDSVTG